MTLWRRISYLILFISLNSSLQTMGQKMLGSVFSIYSGINSTQINPALITGSKAYVDINIIGANSFFKNNWAYIPKEDQNIWQLIGSDTSLFNYGKYKFNRTYTYYNNTDPKFLVQSVRIMGPSAMVQTGKHAFGISIQSRVQSSSTNIPYEIPVFIYEGLNYNNLHDIVYDDNDFNISSLAWTELSLSWGVDFRRFYKNKLSFGVNANLLLGHEGAYNINKNLNYTVHDTSNIEFFNYDAEYGVALPIDYDSKEIIYQDPLVKGYGVGLDLGFVFTRLKSSFSPREGNKLCSKEYEEYLYRIGISLMDIGGISFNKNAQKHNFDNVSVSWAEFDTLEYRSINVSFKQLSQAFYGNPYQSYTSNKISIGLPTTISLQFEGNFIENIYVAALWIQPIQFNAKQTRQASQLSIVPRFENSFFGFSLPITLIQYKYLSLGTAIRLGPLTIGSERIGILLGVSDLDGMDIYFNLKLSLAKGKCSSRKIGACYQWK